MEDDEQREFFSLVRKLNEERLQTLGDPEIQTRINAYEMASRMQVSAPNLVDLRQESAGTLEQYGVAIGQPSFATNCLLARRMVERGVRFVQLYHTEWDHHGGKGQDLDVDLKRVCRETDQPTTALILDLKERGLLEKTLVIWGGEFGRTPMGETRETTGRDHHVDGYTMWLCGAGIKPGYIHGATDELGAMGTENRTHVHDLNATILHLLGIDHKLLTFRFQGRDYRLTDVHGNVVKEILT